MAQYTQKAILCTFRQMLEEMPFEKITVSALVRRCEISSNTFYYHYRDIYDLLDVWLRGELGRYMNGEPPYEDWKDAAKALLRECKAHSAVIYHIYNSISHEHMERFVFTSCSDTFYRLAEGAAVSYAVPKDKIGEIADVCLYSFSGLFLRFLWGHMREDIDSMVDGYGALIEDFVECSVQKYPRKLA